MEANRTRTQVVMLPTEDISQIHYNKIKYPVKFRPTISYVIKYELSFHKEPLKCKNDGLLSGNQHLYFTTDEDIKEGDYVIYGGKVILWSKYDEEGWNKDIKKPRKIIASTDPKLKSDCGVLPKPIRIPQPSQAFIEKYCKLGGIDEVDVEYEVVFIENSINNYEKMISDVFESKLKVNPAHNTIITHRIVEKMYSKQDLLELTMGNSNIIDWIKENL